MKKLILLAVIALFYSCSTTKVATKKSLFEVILVNNDGGANIKFYEILTEPKEINMLLGDETLRKVIKPKDIIESSFLILNSGPTLENYNRIKILKVLETPTQVEVYVKDSQKNIDTTLANNDTFFPYTIVKINSKKPIVFK